MKPPKNDKAKAAKRLDRVPPYLFARLDKMREEIKARGVDVISLSIGDPDIKTPDFIVEALRKEAGNPENHRYPDYEGSLEFRKAVARFYKRRHGVDLDPKTEVVALIGSKEGIAHFPLAVIDPGDFVLVPSPGYPVYSMATIFAGGEPLFFPLKRENSFLPDLKALEKESLDQVKMMWVNYPNNPTGAGATREYLSRLVSFAKKHNIILAADSAYLELSFNGKKVPSIFEIEGARDIAIEFGSLSKSYNMTGWRIGYAVGPQEFISLLGQVKTNVDSGAFTAIQRAGIVALDKGDDTISENTVIWQKRRDIFMKGLKALGFDPFEPSGTFYVWMPVPKGFDSISFVTRLLEDAGIAATPGNGFGDEGEGYVRFALTVSEERLEEALFRMRKLNITNA